MKTGKQIGTNLSRLLDDITYIPLNIHPGISLLIRQEVRDHIHNIVFDAVDTFVWESVWNSWESVRTKRN